MSRGKEVRKKMTDFCIDCEFAYIDDSGCVVYCDCIEDRDYIDCPYEEEEDFEDF